MAAEQLIEIAGEADIVLARSAARRLATQLGFSLMDQSRITTAVSELARNIVRYATGGNGSIHLKELAGAQGVGIEVVAEDKGPGIPDIDQAMQQGYSSGSGLGLGLSGTKRLTDEMEIRSELGVGTVVIVRKWKR